MVARGPADGRDHDRQGDGRDPGAARRDASASACTPRAQICPVGKVLITIERDGDAGADGVGGAAQRRGRRRPAPAPASPRRRRGRGSRARRRAPAASGGTARDRGAGHAGHAQAGARAGRRHLRGVAGTGPGGAHHLRRRARHQAALAATRAGSREPARRPAPRRAASAAASRRRARALPGRAQEDRRAPGAVEAHGRALHLRRGGRLHRLVELREQGQRAPGRRGASKLSFLPFIIKATVGGAAQFPQLNATLDEAARRDRAARASTTSAWPPRPTAG